MRVHSLLFLLLLLLLSTPALALEASDNAASHPLPVGADMPDLQLGGEISPAHLDRLGLKGAGPYPLSSIDAETIILVAFSMYCPHCQREAPLLNELDAQIKGRADKTVRLIGVGIGNSSFEVQVFREKYAITFPLFSDPDFKTNKAMGEVGTPFYYVLKRTAKGGFRVAQTQLGRMESAASFLEQALTAVGQ